LSNLEIGDKVEILYHINSEYRGKLGTISYIGAGLMQGTNPLDYNIEMPDQERRYVIIMEDNTILGDVQSGQLRKA